jgi:phospholipid transport system substrate-binding protein
MRSDFLNSLQLLSRGRRAFLMGAVALTAMLSLVEGARAQDAKGPEALIREISAEVIDTVKSDKAIQAGDRARVTALVDAKVLPHVNFQRMTASTVGPAWRQASPAQRERLQAEFKQLLVRVYAGALTQIKGNTTIELKPNRGGADPKQTEVVSEVRVPGSPDPIRLSYRLENTDSGWKIYDVNVAGIWLVENYKTSFREEVGKGGVEGLINALAEKNRAALASKG